MQQFCTTYELTLNKEHNNLLWDAFVYEQSKNGTYAAELFIKAAAALIGVTIILHQSSTPENFHLIKLVDTFMQFTTSPDRQLIWSSFSVIIAKFINTTSISK